MIRYISILYVLLLFTSCDQSTTQRQQDYIKHLEEKNKALEEELQEANSKIDPKKISHKYKQTPKSYFSIGSTENEVIDVMGDPTQYMITAPEAKRFYYGLSAVYFYRGKVISYDNLDDNLKVRVKK
jgi:hypothetical protein